MGKILKIDLTTLEYEYTFTPPKLIKEFIGGRGLALKLLFDLIEPETDAFSPKNPLIFSPGLFCGTKWPASTQFHVSSKSPLSNGYGSAFAWGGFGIEMKKAGLDALIIIGVAQKPVYIYIEDDQISIKDAGNLWGKTTGEVDDKLLALYPGAKVCTIGPAGEKKVGLASIVSEKYQNLIRTGMGAVMGSKKLKAVVIKGSSKTDVDNAEFTRLARIKKNKVETHKASVRLREVGKAMLVKSKNQVGDLATKNHQQNTFEYAHNMDGDALKKYVTHNVFCPTCPIGCLRFSVIKDGPYKCATEGPEYEPIWALGPRIGNPDLKVLIYANRLCLDLGLDQIGVGGVIAFAMECKQRGILEDDEYSLEWGDAESIVGLIKDIADQKGLGRILGNGSKKAAMSIGNNALDYAMEVKGVEISGQEPRQSKAFGLQLAVSNWGADWGYGLPTIDVAHNEAVAKKYLPELMPEVLDVSDETNKAALVVFSENYNALTDSLGLCKFSAPETYAIEPDDAAEGLSAFWGEKVSRQQVLELGNKIINLERLFNVREGFNRQDDYLPSRFTKEELEIEIFTGDRLVGLVPTGEKRKVVIDLERLLDEYYQLRGWSKNGIPQSMEIGQVK